MSKSVLRVIVVWPRWSNIQMLVGEFVAGLVCFAVAVLDMS